MSKKKTISQPAMVSGMEIETYKKYVEARKGIDKKMFQLTALGWAVQKISDSNYSVEHEECHLSSLGGLIESLADVVYGELENFSGTNGLTSKIKLNDRREVIERNLWNILDW